MDQDFGPPGWIVALFAAFFLLVLTLIVVGAVTRYRAAKRAGLDPWAADIQVMGRVHDSAMLAPPPVPGAPTGADGGSVEARLARLTGLRDAGTITGEEYDEQRARILRDL